jgi:hypothetical protein
LRLVKKSARLNSGVAQKEFFMTCKVKKINCHVMGVAMVSAAILFYICSSEEAFTADKIPEPATWAFPDIIESARKRTPRNVEGRLFNQFGLVYSLEELEKLPIETMAPKDLQKYADIVTHAYPDAVFRQFPASCKEISLKQLNETTIAGIAYVSLNAIDPGTRERAANCLREIQKRLKEESRSK